MTYSFPICPGGQNTDLTKKSAVDEVNIEISHSSRNRGWTLMINFIKLYSGLLQFHNFFPVDPYGSFSKMLYCKRGIPSNFSFKSKL